MVDLLIQVDGVDVNKANKAGVTPLIIAAYLGLPSCVSHLLSHAETNRSLRYQRKMAAQWAEPGARSRGLAYLNGRIRKKGRRAVLTSLKAR